MYLGKFFYSGIILLVTRALQRDTMNTHFQRDGKLQRPFVTIFLTMALESPNNFGTAGRFMLEKMMHLPV